MSDLVSALFDMTGKVALLTGSGRGIGLAMAQALASAGCAVALQDIDLPTAQNEAAAINRAGGKAVAFGGDIRDLSLAGRLIGEVMASLGRLDVLVNNASIQKPAPWSVDTVANMHEQFTADLVSPIVFIQEAWKIFKAQRSGRIINIGSCQQRAATGDMFPYSISKGGLEKITAGLCREMAHHGVTINQIAPGWCNTYRNREQLTSPEVVAQLGKRHVPLGRLGEPDDFRGIILLLCSNAGSYITGQQIFIDGGLTGTGPG
jgi:gluconate 5-dehydrogenase